MNFTELKEELYARGTDYLEEDAAGVARAERWLNQAYREILNLHAWPFLQTSVGGGTPMVIQDLRKILYVVDASSGTSPGRPLHRISRADLVHDGEDESQIGTPESYYVYVENGLVLLTTHPQGDNVSVSYIKRVPLLSATDEPVFEEEYHDIIVDKAMVKVYKDSDNFEVIPALKLEINERLAAMAEDYMLDSREVQFLEPSGTDV